MEIILTQDVENVGSKDDIVSVKDGFGRNYLIPRGFAYVASKSAIKDLEEKMRQRAHKETKILEEAQSLAAKLEGTNLKIGAKAGENGKIFGSVNTIQIAEALTKAGFEIDRKDIKIANDNIKELGEYEADVKIHKSVIQKVKFEVVGE